MKRHKTVPKCIRPDFSSSHSVIAALLIVVVVSLAACSTIGGSSEGTWRASYFTNPNRVWNAIQLTLLDLDYEITEKNRPDGVLRAESEASDDGTVIVLAIDQLVRTEDQVNVFVKPSFAGDGEDANPDFLKAAADAFMASLNAKLNP